MKTTKIMVYETVITLGDIVLKFGIRPDSSVTLLRPEAGAAPENAEIIKFRWSEEIFQVPTEVKP